MSERIIVRVSMDNSNLNLQYEYTYMLQYKTKKSVSILLLLNSKVTMCCFVLFIQYMFKALYMYTCYKVLRLLAVNFIINLKVNILPHYRNED